LNVALSALELKQEPSAANIDTNFVDMLHNTQATVKELRRKASHVTNLRHKLVTHLSNNLTVSSNVTQIADKINSVGITNNKN
jgi:hypothetical protein